MQNSVISVQSSSRKLILTAGLLLYCGAFVILLGNKSFDIGGAVVVLIVFGIVLPLIAWITTRHAVRLSISIHVGASELIVLCGCIIALSLYLIGGPQWIDQHLPASWIDSTRIKFFIVLTKKLVVFDSVSVIEFEISAFSARVCVRSAVVTCLSSLSLEERLLLFNISSVAAARRFDRDTSPCINCFLAFRFASFGF
jgi:hypothetical protein